MRVRPSRSLRRLAGLLVAALAAPAVAIVAPAQAVAAPPHVVVVQGGARGLTGALQADGTVSLVATTTGGAGKPEAIVEVPDPLTNTSAVQLMTDSGDTVFSGDGTITKDLPPPLRKSTSVSVPVGAPPACISDVVTIGSVEGTTDTSPVAGQTVSVRGTVVGDYEGASPALRGFYLQDGGDGNPATSDGVFVFDNGTNLVSNGDVVQVTGSVSEFQGQTRITPSSGGVEACGRQATVTPTDVTLPRTDPGDLEPYEGTLVRFHQTFTVTEEFQLGRFGQVVVSSGGRLRQPTAVNRATDTAAVAALQHANDLNRLIIDDGDNGQNPDPIIFGRGGQPLSASNTLRGGDTVTNPVGVLTYTWAGNAASGNAYRLRPVSALGGAAMFDAVNDRPPAPPATGAGGVHVASANLLNFFNTFTGCHLGTLGATTDCRGAENDTEYQRQLAKEVASLRFLNADVVGIMEMENDGYSSASAIQALVDALNAQDGAGTWAFVNPDAATGVTDVAGSDAIKAGLLYRTARVAPVAGDIFVDQTDLFERRPVAQTFQTPPGARFTVVANHFKSKGSCPTSGPDTAQGDGQSCWNAHRTDQATELARWLHDTVVPQVGDPDVLIVGDLNSYAGEDPVAALESAGYTNLAKSYGGPNAYSYVFDGQWGYLDYVMASGSLATQVTGAGDAHHNADEPSVLDYNTDFTSAGQIASLYAPDRFRTSDHDPVLVGLNPVTATSTTLAVTPASPAAAGTVEVLTATVSPPAAGHVQFKDGATALGGPVAVTAGTASVTTTLVPGSHALTAVFTPTDTTAFSPSTSPAVTYVVNPAVTTTTLDVTPASPAAAGTAETLTATVTPAAAGSVQFKDSTATLGDPVPVTAGKASLPVTLVPGSHSLTAVFTPTDTTAFTSSMSPEVTFVVNAAATSITLDVTPASPAAPGTVERLTATVTPAVVGSVQFRDGVTTLGGSVGVPGNTASLTTTLGPGSHSLTAVFTPTDTTAFGPSTSPAVTFVVNPAGTTTRLDVTPAAPAAAGTVEMVTATVTPSAAGSVQFKDGTTTLAAPVTVTAGTASMPVTLAPGSHSLTAVFTPTDTTAFGPSTSPPVTFVVYAVATGTTLQVAPSPAIHGLPLVLIARVSPLNAAGTVQFTDGNTAVGAPVSVLAGQAILITSAPPKGTHTLIAVFTPTNPAAFGPSTSPPVSLTVQ